MLARRHSGTAIAIASAVCVFHKGWLLLDSHFLGTHARTQGLVKGKLVVLDDLPKHLKQSMFEHGGEYQVVARYSSEPGDPGLDVGCPSLIKINSLNVQL